MLMIDPIFREIATETQLKYLDALQKHGSGRAAAKALGVSKSALNESLARLKHQAAIRGFAPDFDLTHPTAPGQLLKGASTLYKDGKPVMQWVKTAADQDKMLAIVKQAANALCEELPRLAPVKAPKQRNEDLCNLFVFTDYHLGQLSWHKEGGADWDLSIAENMLVNSFQHMIMNSPDADSCVLCLQGDFLHTDGYLPLTPAHKNLLDADSRFPKIVDVAIRVIRRIAEMALETHRNVRLIIAEGNHDESASMWLRKLFAALYEKEPRISVDCSELPYYVHQFGDVMLAFHHGHKVSNEQLPMLFAAQYPKVWGDTVKRYCHTGHRHHVDEKEYAGMTVMQHATLTARDAHAARGGWISERAAQAITYHRLFGQVGRTFVCPEMFYYEVA